jgi:NAD(P)-dependent dehydrogenase (short-subunit alcohol dehydrogenase family)
MNIIKEKLQMTYLEEIFGIKNKVAVITGGSGILGGEMAKGLLKAGAKVILLARNEDKLKMKVDELGITGNEIAWWKCDVLNEMEIRKVHEKILHDFKYIDILINAAGGHVPDAIIDKDQSIFDLKIENFKKVNDLNFHGTVLPTLIFGKTMAKGKTGSIINISSMASQRAISRAAGYSAAKAAIENFTKWMAVEMALKFGNGIRVNAIAPGFLLTNQNRNLLTRKDGTLTERGETIINMTPFKRFGIPDELIGTVLWLASDASKFVTGSIIPVDGGFSVYSGV